MGERFRARPGAIESVLEYSWRLLEESGEFLHGGPRLGFIPGLEIDHRPGITEEDLRRLFRFEATVSALALGSDPGDGHSAIVGLACDSPRRRWRTGLRRRQLYGAGQGRQVGRSSDHDEGVRSVNEDKHCRAVHRGGHFAQPPRAIAEHVGAGHGGAAVQQLVRHLDGRKAGITGSGRRRPGVRTTARHPPTHLPRHTNTAVFMISWRE
jgi:hypothetical protein